MLGFVQQLQLGDIVISVETGQSQAEERRHALLDEMIILMVSLFHFIASITLFSLLPCCVFPYIFPNIEP